ncbi:mitochondrial fission process protein 1 [Ambystoma mexicanum]|uniref:mitochondrial fission process protein 1 n=1 Tax=Ambystoma mexicanum TaxID=8296 RepID=UPI0037E756FC
MGPHAQAPHGSPPAHKDIYRDTWVRYLGYANEVGEAFRALVPVKLVWASYGVATAYVTADAVDKGRRAAVIHTKDSGQTAQVTIAVVDTFIWQALASVAIPGFTINRICAASLYLLRKSTRWPLPVRRWTTTAIGLSAIPFIITPIDRSVDFLLDSSLRKLYSKKEGGLCPNPTVPTEVPADTRST